MSGGRPGRSDPWNLPDPAKTVRYELSAEELAVELRGRIFTEPVRRDTPHRAGMA